MLYVTRWPAAYTSDPVPSYVNTFVIHGVWPTLSDNDYPCDCTNQAFNFTEIQDLYPQLEEAWYDFDGPNSTSLWSHEWDKHGTCATNVGITGLATEHDYFDLGIKLHTQLDITSVLNAAGIVPTNSTTYPTTSVVSALQNAFGVPPLINCFKSGGKTVLYQIAFCISDTTLDATTCDSCVTNQWASNEDCGSSVSLLPINFLPN